MALQPPAPMPRKSQAVSEQACYPVPGSTHWDCSKATMLSVSPGRRPEDFFLVLFLDWGADQLDHLFTATV